MCKNTAWLYKSKEFEVSLSLNWKFSSGSQRNLAHNIKNDTSEVLLTLHLFLYILLSHMGIQGLLKVPDLDYENSNLHS